IPARCPVVGPFVRFAAIRPPCCPAACHAHLVRDYGSSHRTHGPLGRRRPGCAIPDRIVPRHTPGPGRAARAAGGCTGGWHMVGAPEATNGPTKPTLCLVSQL